MNSWTKSSSGDWDEPSWSLGVLPASNHDVFITNTGAKTVFIRASTVQNHPQSLTVNTLTLSSPADSFNTLVLDHAGLQVPLTVKQLTVGSNSALAILSSALLLNGNPGSGLSIGGQFSQREASLVSGTQLDVGYVGPGTYLLESGHLNVEHIWVGGPFAGAFNQTGGSNSSSILHLEPGGIYNLHDGEFNSTVYSADDSLFRQEGGRTHSKLEFFRGQYLFSGGVNLAGLQVPVAGNWASDNGNSSAIQSGGISSGHISLGYFGSGLYTLSNGIVQSPISVRHWGHFRQAGGIVTTPTILPLVGGWVDRGDRALAYYTLEQGYLSSPGIHLATGRFVQSGGTNLVAGDVLLPSTTHNYFVLSNGLLSDLNTTIHDAYVGGFYQYGGTHLVSNTLSISASATYYLWDSYVLAGGELIVSNIHVSLQGVFAQSGGSVIQSGILSMNAGILRAAPGAHQFGPLLLLSTPAVTNADLFMPSNSCLLRFRHSSSLAWSNDAQLTIHNWAGSPFGGAAHQIIFGTDATAVTETQLRQIVFVDPAGLSPGRHAAKILPNGEIVPDALPPTGNSQPRMSLQKQFVGMQVTLHGESGYRFGIQTSSNLISWALWTNGIPTNGSFSVLYPTPASQPYLFYRGVLIP